MSDETRDLTTDEHGTPRVRARIGAALLVLFKLTLVGFLVVGTVLVLTQLCGALLGSASVVSGAVDVLTVPSTVLASIAGLCGFALSYVTRWKSSD